MNIHEYQARALLEKHGVPVPRGEMVESADQVRQVAKSIGDTVVVKAQIHAGGRGKGKFRGKSGQEVNHPTKGSPLGGVVVTSADSADEIARSMLGNILVTKQTGEAGREVRKLMIAEGLEIDSEFYLAILLDRAYRSPVFIASKEGGTEIEKVAAERPEAILKVPVDPRVGYADWIGRKIAFGLGMPANLVRPTGKLVQALYKTFMSTDASLVEINPLIVTGDGDVLALDAKMNFDDNALFRQQDVAELRDQAEEDALEVEAASTTSTTSRSTATSAAWSTAPAWPWRRWTSSSCTAASRPTSSTSAAAPRPSASPTAFKILLGDPNVKASWSTSSAASCAATSIAEGVVAAAKEVGVTCRWSSGSRAPTSRRAARSCRTPVCRSSRPTTWTTRREGRASRGRRHQMSILVDKDTESSVQGFTGKQGTFHTQQAIEYGTKVVGGVTPGKGGTKSRGLPVFDTVAEAVARPAPTLGDLRAAALRGRRDHGGGRRRDASWSSASPRASRRSTWSRSSAPAGHRSAPGRPELPGRDHAGRVQDRHHAGHHPQAGPVGVVSRSGTLTYEAVRQLTAPGSARPPASASAAIRSTARTSSTASSCSEDDRDRGDRHDRRDRRHRRGRGGRVHQANVTKPVVGFIAGRTAPPGKRMGHAGAIISGGKGTAVREDRGPEGAAGSQRRGQLRPRIGPHLQKRDGGSVVL